MLYEDKTEVLLCGPPSRRESLKLDEDETDVLPSDQSGRTPTFSSNTISIGGTSIPFSNTIKTLGVYFDSDLSFEQQVSSIVKSCHFLIRSLSRVRPYLTQKAANTIAVSLVLSKLDYCNSLLSGLPQKHIQRLQAVQNEAAKVIMRSRKYDHVMPVLSERHRLPV